MPPSVPSPTASTGKFFGVKVSKSGIPVNQATDDQLLYKNDFQAQTFYAENGSSISFGNLTDGTLGMEVKDSNGNMLFKMDGQTWFWYDISTGKNIMQAGLLPDGSYGWAVVPPGNDISQAFS